MSMGQVFKRAARIGLGFGLALCLWLVAGFLPASAEERELTTETKGSVDAVLLVDGSGSMRTTDPARLRDEGASLFARFLNPGDRLAIVEFSDQAKVVRPLSEFQEGDSAKISQDLAKIGDNGQYTDILAGLKMASAILQESGRPLEANQVIILLSDGKMEPDPVSASPEQRTKDLIDGLLPDLRENATKVYTLYFSEEADKELLSQIAAATDAVNWFAPSADKIHEAYADMFLAIKKPQVVPIQGRAFIIDPDIEEATFYVNREGDEEISLVSPEGKKIASDTQEKNIKWFKGKQFDVVTIMAPKEGAWRVGGLPSAESFATVLTNIRLVTDWLPVGTSGEPALLQARLYEGPRPLDLKLLTGVTRLNFFITPTDKISEPILRETLVDDGSHGDKIAGDGIYSYEIRIDDAGEYRLSIGAKSETFQRNQQIPFRIRPRRISLSVITETAAIEPKIPGQQTDVPGELGEAFKVELSAEASALRNAEVKLFALGPDKKLYRLPVTRLPGTPYKFLSKVSTLPREGEYTLYATLTGQGKKDKRVSDESLRINYNYALKSGAEPGAEAIEIVPKRPPEPSKVPFYINLLMVILTNSILCWILLKDLKRIQVQAAVGIPSFPSLQGVGEAIEMLKAKMSKSDVDLNDPMFAPQVDLPRSAEAELEAEVGGDAQADAEASAGVAEPAEANDKPADKAEPGDSSGEGG